MTNATLVDLPVAWGFGWLEWDMIVYFGVAYLVTNFVWKKARRRKNATKLNWETLGHFANDFEWKRVELSSIQDVDPDYYDQVTKELGELGYQKMADVEYLHVSKAHPEMQTVVRLFVIGHGQISAAAYHARVAGRQGFLARLVLGKREFRVVDFQTAMSDGSFVLTSNAGDMLALTSAHEIKKCSLGEVIPLKVHQEQHIARVKQFCSETVQPLVANTMSELMRLEEIQYRIEQEHRKSVGGLSGDEVERMSEKVPMMTKREGRKLGAEVEQVNA